MNDEAITGQRQGSQTIPADASQQDSPLIRMHPQYVTAQQLAEEIEKVKSFSQSLVDKKGNAINAKIAQLKNAGITVTSEQAEKLIAQEEASAQQEVQPQQEAQPAAGMAPTVDPAQAEWITKNGGNPTDPYWGTVYDISKQAGGMLIEADDPEIEFMKQKFDNGSAFVAAFAQAIASKRLRLSNNKSQGYASIPALFSGRSRIQS